jgi:signal transduction histidine kinase/ActR/RegA family two-component response regulator
MAALTSPIFRRRLALAAGLTAASTVSAHLGLALIVESDGAAPIWAANGFLAAALLLLPRAWGAGVLIACFIGQVGLGVIRGDTTALGLSLSAVNMGEALLVAWLARLVCGHAVRLTNLARVARLLFLAVAPAAAVSALAAAAIQMHLIAQPFAFTFVAWFVSDGLGMALVLPAVLLTRGARRDFRRPLWEQAGIYSLLAVLAVSVFLVKGAPMHFLLFPAALVAAFRLGPRGTGYAMLMLTFLIVGCVVLLPGQGVNPDWSMAQRIRAGQLMIATIFFTSLATAMAVADQARLKRLWANRSNLARRAQARAQKASRAKAEFLATMSHEIRTPMNSILGFTQVLLRRDDLPGDARRQLDLIDQSGASLLTVVNDILDFSKMEAGQIDLQPQACAPRQAAEAALAIVADAAKAKGLDVALVCEGDCDSPVMLDDLRVRQILLNLLSNAVKFTNAGEIRLTLQASAETDALRRLRFTVADTGVGVAADKLDRLFKRFSQADSSVSRAYGGTGLGLAICKGLTERMGGQIGVESMPGVGSRFWFEFPVETAAAMAEAEADDSLETTEALRVLLVDDHPMNRELGATVLGILGCKVGLADSGEEAIAAVQRNDYDVILMDLHMPHMDGWEAARRIGALGGEAARTPIIALSADVMPETAEQCRRAGMVDMAAKPIRIEALHAVLTQWAGRSADGARRAA